MKTNFLILLIAFSSTLFAQKKLADKFFDNYGYVKASELYEKAVENGDHNKHILTRLGDCYYNNSNSEKAVYWYSKAADKYDLESDHLFRLIQSLKSIGNYSEAEKWIKKLIEIQNDENHFKDYSSNSLAKYEELNSLNKDSYIVIENLPINSKFSDFGTFINNDQFYFASARNQDETKKYAWNKEPYLDLFQTNIKENKDSLVFGEVNFIKASKVNLDIAQESFDGEKTSKIDSVIKLIFGGASGYLLFMFIIIYGNMIMRSVIEEKTSRIIEIIISSVKPVQLMLGKIIGTSLAGITQFVICAPMV